MNSSASASPDSADDRRVGRLSVIEIRLWGTGGEPATRLIRSPIASEELLETLIGSDPSILGERLIIIGRQVQTRGRNGIVDLLAIDASGRIWVIELKKGAAARGVTSQLVGYGCWVVSLSRAEIVSIFAHYTNGASLEEAFYEHFGKALPADINADHVLTVVATSVNGPAQHELRYLEGGDRLVNIVLYEHFTDRGTVHLIKAWTASRRAAELAVNQTEPRPVAHSLGHRSFPIKTHHYDDEIREPHKHVEDFWNAYARYFQWDFLPPSFLWALYEQWAREESTANPHRAPLTMEVFRQRLRVVAAESGDWKFTQASAPHHMKAAEPLTDLVPHWERDTDKAPTWGYRRIRTTRRSSGDQGASDS